MLWWGDLDMSQGGKTDRGVGVTPPPMSELPHIWVNPDSSYFHNEISILHTFVY